MRGNCSRCADIELPARLPANVNRDDLHALLAETTGGDARADRFLAIVLGLEDYGQFCGLMQAHAATLAVAAEMESVALS